MTISIFTKLGARNAKLFQSEGKNSIIIVNFEAFLLAYNIFLSSINMNDENVLKNSALVSE